MRSVLTRHLPFDTGLVLPQTRQFFPQQRKSLLMTLTAEMCHDRKPDPWQMAAAPAWARPQLATTGVGSLR
jgi:hypothetical protein